MADGRGCGLPAAAAGLVVVGVLWWGACARAANPIRWTLALDASPLSIAVDDRAGTAFVLGTAVGTPPPARLMTIDTARGVVVRSSTVAAFPQALTVDAPRDRVVIAAADSTIHVLDAWTGRPLRALSLPNLGVGVESLLRDDAVTGRVFVTGEGGVSVLAARSGRLLRSISLGLHPQGLAVALHLGQVLVSGYADTSNVGTVCALDARDGHILWRLTLPQSPNPTLVAIDERRSWAVVLDSLTDVLSVIDLRSGQIRRTVNLGQALRAVAIDADTARTFAATAVTADEGGTGTVRVVDTRSGRVIRTVAVDGQPMAVALDAGCVFVVATAPRGKGQVSSTIVLDATDGRVRRIIPLQMVPRAMAVDQVRGLVLVAGEASGDATGPPYPWGWIPSSVRHWFPFLPGPPQRARLPGGRVSIIDVSRL